jgi:hypothetical protein
MTHLLFHKTPNSVSSEPGAAQFPKSQTKLPKGLIDADRTKIEKRLQSTRENYRLMRERLLKRIYWLRPPENLEDLRTFKLPLNKDVIEAAKNS